MDEDLSLGRIAGIRIGINWSWLVVFALIVWTLAANVFPHHDPGLSDGAYLAMAIAAALLFFASLLLHELGHALQARREGMEIEGITLWLFGGIAKFKGMFPSAGAEFRIAIAGPLVTLTLGLLFVLVAWASALPTSIDGVAAWLGYINLVLLVFNLLPALPLDGGRVLRASLWRTRGDLAWSTRVAAEIGRGFGYLLIAFGLFQFFFASSFGGAWFAFIGWFLLLAASQENRSLAARQALGGLHVRDLMVREPVTVGPDLTLAEFVDTVVSVKRYTTYPVTEDGKALGLLPFRRVADVPRRDWESVRVRDSMLTGDQLPRLSADDELVEALAELGESEVKRGLVVDGERLDGLLSVTDIARAPDVGSPRRARRAIGQ